MAQSGRRVALRQWTHTASDSILLAAWRAAVEGEEAGTAPPSTNPR